jgi:hypothetical protein
MRRLRRFSWYHTAHCTDINDKAMDQLAQCKSCMFVTFTRFSWPLSAGRNIDSSVDDTATLEKTSLVDSLPTEDAAVEHTVEGVAGRKRRHDEL